MTGKQVTSGGYHHMLLMFFPTGYLPDLSLRVIPRPASMLSHAHLPRQVEKTTKPEGASAGWTDGGGASWGTAQRHCCSGSGVLKFKPQGPEQLPQSLRKWANNYRGQRDRATKLILFVYIRTHLLKPWLGLRLGEEGTWEDCRNTCYFMVGMGNALFRKNSVTLRSWVSTWLTKEEATDLISCGGREGK